jgi:cytoskeletal protein RodZ
MGEIGDTLRERRIGEKIDVQQVEDATKIRAKYLRALENEEFDLLPGPAYVKSFLRTYADHLGLDGRHLVDVYRRDYEQVDPHDQPIFAGRGGRAGGGPRWARIALAVVVLIVVVIIVVGLLSGGDAAGTAALGGAHAIIAA